ncbi:glucosamine-6-phosphate deaminase [Dysgonomonas sp. 520]|uniref:glucosamine-6-phosphate deaminase n=1 Tax=Dysgonomonas sp. 520 TaxID=2302931 RepID=UPI0013D76CED|nr:glucosamine-6-phosphate deaminase [Dysgonomonas sp. 520]NDW10369.1 glucosamine-6-phosphate deaminase [Dysgonomonas sp. 520]
MKTDLSSQITLDRVSGKYYRPQNGYELTALTRFEKIETHIYESSNEASVLVAREIANGIRKKQDNGENFVLALTGGHSPRNIFIELVRMHKEEKLSFRNVIIFDVYEFYPLSHDSFSNIKLLKDLFLDHIDINQNNVFSPDGTIPKEEILNFCKLYEKRIQNYGGLDYALLGLGRNGNIGLNIPGSNQNSQTRLVLLDIQSRKEAINTFESMENVPLSGITMGVSTIMNAKKITLIAWGEDKSKCIKDVVEGKIDEAIPASYLQLHSNTKIVTDLSAAYELTRISQPWLVTSCDWTDKLIRRAIVWLCFKLDKPILKLTNKDYQDNGLGELLSLFGSAYNVNIKIFNDLQHTITGWPGGKPNADDTNRPERAKPYPKKVVIFSPHPDDDVISMGGTFQRLVNQQHDVHVAYQTSGNIAVGDEEVIRYVSLMENVIAKYNPDDVDLKEKLAKILNFLLHEKKSGDIDTSDVLFIKGRIRREEATSACRFIGLDDSKISFLDLPFYETGKVKKAPISETDVKIIKDYLQKVQPHEVFVAGDLADPHGTHKVCLDAILAAVDELKEEKTKWLKDCRFWMYRGAWQEWEIDHIEMAVPISPEELRQKRLSILRHQSQMESAPFLGNDERLFWQRSEDRNKGTAELYRNLGLAAYEAIEAFVEYKPL